MIQLTFLEGFVNTSLSLSKTFISFHIREHSALVHPIVVMRAKEEHREVPHAMFQALDIQWHRPGAADLCWPPYANIKRF
jgi:hypothetical protein